ncbi:hypothetical protein AB0C21_09965 [Spirillospora sp. NPDC049024]
MGVSELDRWLIPRKLDFHRKSDSFQLRYILPVTSLAFLVIILMQLVPDLEARLGDGTRGTFTAQHLECEDDCRWYGQFTSEDGRRRPSEVYLMDAGKNDLTKGAKATAIDTGSPAAVHPLAGPSTWWRWFFVLVLSAVMAVTSALAWRVWLRDRRNHPDLDEPPGHPAAKAF